MAPTIIDGDKYCALANHRGAICDYLVFSRETPLIAVVVEMKGKAVDARRAVDQIRAGSRVAEKITATERVSGFYPLLLSQAVKHALEVKVLRKQRVRFRGVDHRVIYKKCGVRLSDVLASFPTGPSSAR